jgi:hypothetical protein
MSSNPDLDSYIDGPVVSKDVPAIVNYLANHGG